MLTDDQITALAREYADERASLMQGSLMTKIQAELVIRFQLRRYYLVEKSKVKQIYQAKQHILANQNVFGITVATEAAAQKQMFGVGKTAIGSVIQGIRWKTED